MKSLLPLLRCVLSDAETWCCTSAARDLITIESRLKHEGLSFLTITLPAFCKDFEKSLDIGQVSPTAFLSFKRCKGLPQFLGGFLDLVFDRNTGVLLDNPSKDAIFFIRQITLMFKKILLPCSTERVKGAFNAYVQCEKEVATWEDQATQAQYKEFAHVASLLWDHDMSVVDRKIHDGLLVPKHGPGATAERVIGNDKFVPTLWTARLDRSFPIADHLIPNYGYIDELDAVEVLEPDAEIPVRVITVPKTLKTPRIIAIEPTCMQYTQQAILELLVDQIERSDYLSGSIGFTDQKPNQWMAQLGSDDGGLATIDLSEASDRVSNRLVYQMLKPYPSLARAVQDSRSRRADVPGFGIMPIRKYASMGSATCFPIEAMVFLTIILLGISDSLNTSLTRKSIPGLLRSVRVYGDDLIIPVEYVRSVTARLTSFGMKVNDAKSFWTGRFRESCGKDYYAGHDVTVVYMRRELPMSRSNALEMISAVSFRNQLYHAGLWKTADYLDMQIRRLAKFPNVLESSPVLGRYSYLGYDTERVCPNLHRPLVKGLVIRTIKRPSPLSGVGALMKFFLKRGNDPVFDVKHLERYGRPLLVDTKVKWDSAT